jgi:uncharacterized protein YdaU (DUF1376 family)
MKNYLLLFNRLQSLGQNICTVAIASFNSSNMEKSKRNVIVSRFFKALASGLLADRCQEERDPKVRVFLIELGIRI